MWPSSHIMACGIAIMIDISRHENRLILNDIKGLRLTVNWSNYSSLCLDYNALRVLIVKNLALYPWIKSNIPFSPQIPLGLVFQGSTKRRILSLNRSHIKCDTEVTVDLLMRPKPPKPCYSSLPVGKNSKAYEPAIVLPTRLQASRNIALFGS